MFGGHKWHEIKHDPQLMRFILVIIILIVVLYFEGVAMGYTDNRANDQGVVTNRSFYLADFGHDVVEKVLGRNFAQHVIGYNDYITVALCLGTVIFIFLFHMGQRLKLLTRYLLGIAILYFIRECLIWTTVSPQSQHYVLTHGCHYYHNVIVAPLNMAFRGWKTCYDTFISGHMFNATFSSLFWTYYYLPTSRPLQKWVNNICCKVFWRIIPIIMWILAFIDGVIILALQLHYTTDVGIAIVLAFFVWYLALRETRLNEGLFAWFEPSTSIYHQDNYNNSNGNNNDNDSNNKTVQYTTNEMV